MTPKIFAAKKNQQKYCSVDKPYTSDHRNIDFVNLSGEKLLSKNFKKKKNEKENSKHGNLIKFIIKL